MEAKKTGCCGWILILGTVMVLYSVWVGVRPNRTRSEGTHESPGVSTPERPLPKKTTGQEHTVAIGEKRTIADDPQMKAVGLKSAWWDGYLDARGVTDVVHFPRPDTRFNEGETVVVEDTSRLGEDLILIRREGDDTAYWIVSKAVK